MMNDPICHRSNKKINKRRSFVCRRLAGFTAAAALAAAAAGLPAYGAASVFLIGDVNGDGVVDEADAATVLAAYAETSSGRESSLYSFKMAAADLNGDNVIDAVDAALILSYCGFYAASNENAIFTDLVVDLSGDKEASEKAENAPDEASPQEELPPIEFGGFDFEYPHIDGVYSDWFWVGDSRTVGMAQSCNIEYIARVGATISLFRNNAEDIYALRDKTIVINLGVNDLDGGAYLSLYNSMPDEFLDNNKVIVMSVNPCDGSYQYLNDRIVSFNDYLSSNLDSRITFLDSYTYLMWNGFSTVDGLHYNTATYNDIYNFVMDSVE